VKVRKATNEEFDTYRNEVKRLLSLFRVNDWSVYFDLEDCPGSQAELITNYTSHVCTFVLSKKLKGDVDVKNSALHEVCHLLISDLSDLNYSRFVTQDEVTRACEATTIKLQSILKELT